MVLVRHLTLFAVLWFIPVCRGSECKVQEAGRGVWIESSRQLRDGIASRITAVFCTLDPVWFQLWTPSADSWVMVWRKQWKPTYTNSVQYLDLPPDEQIKILPNHRLGLAPVNGPNSQISVRKSFNISFIQLISTTQAGPYQLHTKYMFDDIKHPGIFVADFCDTTGCPPLDSPIEISTPSVPVACKMWQPQGHVKLEQHRRLETGVVKAIKTHFCDLSPVVVQLWDDNVKSPKSYRLIWSKKLRPILADGSETIIPLEPKEYINIRSSYKLGLQPLSVDANISVPHKFSTDSSANMVTSSGSSVKLCDEQIFEGIPYPSEFILSFCYDTACNKKTSDPDALEQSLCPNATESPTATDDNIKNATSHIRSAESVKTSSATSIGRHYVSWIVTIVYAVIITSL